MSSSGLFYHEKLPSGIIVAKIVGITSAGFMTGMNTFLSVGVIPAVMKAPAGLAAAQWKGIYETGKVFGPVAALAGTLASAYLASREPISSSTFKLWIASAIFLPSIVPFTILVINPTNTKLLDKADSLAGTELTDKAAEAGVAKEETVHALIDKWATLNLGRALLTGIASVCACIAAVDQLQVVGFTEIGLASGANRMG